MSSKRELEQNLIFERTTTLLASFNCRQFMRVQIHHQDKVKFRVVFSFRNVISHIYENPDLGL